jgi:methylated-DNA-[protein]-cysteine S-methyltransferase
MKSPIGPLLVASTENGLCKISFGKDGDGEFQSWMSKMFPEASSKKNDSENQAVTDSLDQYFAGKLHDFDLKLDLRAHGFQLKALTKLSKVPYGTTITYGTLAARAGSERAARAAGAACATNPIPIVIPCHRVIGVNGKLTGFGGGIQAKRWLLRHEGIELL